jgi:peptidoglycan/LPS O-acetylase OafA/YrhL
LAVDFTPTDTGAKLAPSSEFRNLDLLRAVAVLCVFLAHLCLFLIKFGYLPVARHAEIWDIFLNLTGHLGVLFFFVHTALVLMLSLDRTSSTGMILNFYLRRIFRIYPLCIACILGVLILKVPQVPDGTYAAWYGSEIVSNLLLVQNIFQKPDMIMPLWTLPREFQMYLALPFLYLLLKRISSSIVVLLVWLAFFAAVPSAPLLACFPCFMGGVLAYQLAKERVFRLQAGVWPAAILALAGFDFALNLTVLPDYRADYVLCMLLGLVIPNFADLNEFWLTRVSRSVAKYSYGIYLCHDPVIWFSFIKLKSFPVPARWAALVLLMIAVPVAAHRWLEAPLIDVGRRLATRWTNAYTRFRATRKGVFEESPQLAE